MKRLFWSPGWRNFDPRSVGSLECRAWEMYYRRRWAAVLLAFVGLIRSAFGMSWPRTLQGAWYVLRANQTWAPFPDNHPDAARYGVSPDAVRRAAELRAEAMDVSDRWIEAGCEVGHPLLREERALLVRSFAALLAAVHR